MVLTSHDLMCGYTESYIISYHKENNIKLYLNEVEDVYN